jgi:hypothetical protein
MTSSARAADHLPPDAYYSDKKHVVWANSFVALIDSLQKYVKQYHTTGLTWNPKVSFDARMLGQICD